MRCSVLQQWILFVIALAASTEHGAVADGLQNSVFLKTHCVKCHGIDVPHNWLFIAMAHWQLDQKDHAEQWYDKSLAWQQANKVAAKADTELRGFYAEAAKLMDSAQTKPAADQKPPAETEPDKKLPKE